jgi:hypothetical protein
MPVSWITAASPGGVVEALRAGSRIGYTRRVIC